MSTYERGPTAAEEAKSLNSWPSQRPRYDVNLEHGTHLTIYGGRNIHSDKDKYQTRETGHARERVDLFNEKISQVTEGIK